MQTINGFEIIVYILTKCIFKRARLRYLRATARVNENNEVKSHNRLFISLIHKYGQIF